MKVKSFFALKPVANCVPLLENQQSTDCCSPRGRGTAACRGAVTYIALLWCVLPWWMLCGPVPFVLRVQPGSLSKTTGLSSPSPMVPWNVSSCWCSFKLITTSGQLRNALPYLLFFPSGVPASGETFQPPWDFASFRQRQLLLLVASTLHPLFL